MPHARGKSRVRATTIVLMLSVLAGAPRARAEQAPPATEPPGIVVEMGPAEVPARPGTPLSPPTLSDEVRALRERVEALERALIGLLEALPIVASGVVVVPPSARTLADPIANPLGFARLEPGRATVPHGLGAAEVTVYLAVVSPEGRVSYQVPAGALFANAPSPPDGTFTVYNATERPLEVRWWALLHAAAGGRPAPEGTP
ncbi:MAG: hypothetical protein HY575_09295 [candidate division NC10 bacterium]|nr:hypothetical protein [candidate division NC10 bacterium]